MTIREEKKYTIKEWKRLYSLQEVLCKKFDIILTDHKTKKEKIFSLLNNINFKNITMGIDTFNKSVDDFGKSMDKLVTELDEPPKNNVKIWSDPPKKSNEKSQDQINLKKIWGSKDD